MLSGCGSVDNASLEKHLQGYVVHRVDWAHVDIPRGREIAKEGHSGMNPRLIEAIRASEDYVREREKILRASPNGPKSCTLSQHLCLGHFCNANELGAQVILWARGGGQRGHSFNYGFGKP